MLTLFSNTKEHSRAKPIILTKSPLFAVISTLNIWSVEPTIVESEFPKILSLSSMFNLSIWSSNIQIP